MTAHRPRDTGERYTFIEVFLSGAAAPRTNWRVGRPTRLWQPPTDVYETEDAIIVQVEIAGVQSADFRIELFDHILCISGTRVDPNSEQRAFYQMELRFGDFRTEAEIPVPVDKDRLGAEYGDGFLRVTLPKLPPTASPLTE